MITKFKLFEKKYEDFKDDINKVFENREWLVIQPKSFESFLYWSSGTNWRMVRQPKKYFDYNKAFLTPKLPSIYLLINKDDDKKYYFDFYYNDFYDEGEDRIELKEFFDINFDLFTFFGEILDSDFVVKDNNEYWLVIPENDYFADYFKLDNRTRSDLIKKILGGDSYEIFSYSTNDFNINDDIDFNEKNLELLMMILRVYKIDNDYDYDLTKIRRYRDITDIIEDYDLDDVKDLIVRCICDGHERADADAAYNNILDEAYSFFNLVDGSAKWQKYKNSQHDKLWIKFKSDSDAYYAKFRIENYDESYSEDMINYSPPYYGYSGDRKDINDNFNEEFAERFWEYIPKQDAERISKYVNILKEIKKQNPNIKEDQIFDEIKLRIDAEKYNL